MEAQMFSKEFQPLVAVQEKKQELFLSKSNVVGVGLGPKVSKGNLTGDYSINIYVTTKLDKSFLDKNDVIPRTIDGVKTDVVETGVIFAQPSISLKKHIRPAKGGYSVGHEKITAGTIGTCVIDTKPHIGIPNKYYILSNNHVLANSNMASIGDPILQPGPYDGGTMPNDLIAKLSRFVPIDFNGKCNYVDAAIAEGDLDKLNRDIYWVGHVKGMRKPEIDLELHKTGRTTGHSSGKITGINATVNVNYGGGKVAKFCRQIITTAMSQGGDSGSLMVDKDNNAVGLLFAGSSVISIANDIRYVMKMLQVKFH